MQLEILATRPAAIAGQHVELAETRDGDDPVYDVSIYITETQDWARWMTRDKELAERIYSEARDADHLDDIAPAAGME